MQVRLENIVKKFGNTVAVDKFSAILPDGHLICLLGPSGCGKSTILNLLCGILSATEGKIFFDDENVTDLPSDKRGIGMVFQNYALYPHLTVLDNICFPLEVQKVPKKERREKAAEIAKLVHVDGLLKRYPGELSGGQQQRVAIARALIKQPKLLLMDEPLSNLDARLRLEMREEIRRIQKETGVTTVFVTHDQEEAMAISDSILLMKNGKLIQEGLCQDLYNQPNCKFVSDFMGNPPINVLSNSETKIEENALYLGNTKIFQKEELASLKDTNAKLLLSVRPESFVIYKKDNSDANAPSSNASNSIKIPTKITSISQMGKENVAYFNNNEIRAVINNDVDFSINEEVFVSLKTKGVFLFDAESGERLM